MERWYQTIISLLDRLRVYRRRFGHERHGVTGVGAWGYARATSRMQILDGWRRGMPEVPGETVSLLQGDLTDADAIVRGTATLSGEVIDETSNTLVRAEIVSVVSANEKALRYPKFRVRYLLDLLFALDEAHSMQSRANTAWSLAQEKLIEATRAGRLVRTDLSGGLNRATEGHRQALAELRENRGSAGGPGEIAASLRSMAQLVEDWLANTDRSALLRLAAVDADDVHTAREAAAFLETATRDLLAFPASARDVPSTNLIEGRLMFELAQLHRALEDKQGILAGLPRLMLGNTLRRELRRVTDPEAEAETSPKPDPETP